MSNYCQLMIVWQYSDDILTIQWQYFDDILTIFWHCHLRSISSFFALLIVICAESFQMLSWQIFTAKITQTYLNVRQKPSKSHDPQKRSQAIILGGRVGCVSWLTPCWCKIFRINEYMSLHVQIKQFSLRIYVKKTKKSVLWTFVHFPSWLATGLVRVDSMDSNVTKFLSFATKSSLGMQPLPLMLPKDPLRQYMGGILMTRDHAPFPIGSVAAAMIEFLWWPCKAI